MALQGLGIHLLVHMDPALFVQVEVVGLHTAALFLLPLHNGLLQDPEIAGADWYVCSSLDEAYPLTVGEALVLGTPVLGTDCTGIREWLEESRYGILLDNSVDGIYEGMKRVLHMVPEEYSRWKQAAAEKAEQISFRAQLEQWERDMIGN